MPKPTRDDKKAGCIVVSCFLPLFFSFFLSTAPRAFPICTNLYQLINASGYVDTKFIVTSVDCESGDAEALPFCWADGTIEADNSAERCALIFGYSHVSSKEQLETMMPVGTKFAVKHNPDMMKAPVQGSTLRVIINEPDNAFDLLWRSTIHHLVWAIVPLGLSLLLVYYVARPRWKALNEKFPDKPGKVKSNY